MHQLQELVSLEVRRPERIASIGRPRYLVMVGGMCAGKSTLAHAAASAKRIDGRCIVAKRCSTREPRASDRADGVSAVSWTEFHRLRDSGAFLLSWERPLIDQSTIGYGCFPPVQQGLPILMAGHGIYSNSRSVRPLHALDQAVIVGVFAPADVRAARLRLRSPDVISLGQERAQALLAHDDSKMIENVDLLVRNHGLFEPIAKSEFIQAVNLILDHTS